MGPSSEEGPFGVSVGPAGSTANGSGIFTAGLARHPPGQVCSPRFPAGMRNMGPSPLSHPFPRRPLPQLLWTAGTGAVTAPSPPPRTLWSTASHRLLKHSLAAAGVTPPPVTAARPRSCHRPGRWLPFRLQAPLPTAYQQMTHPGPALYFPSTPTPGTTRASLRHPPRTPVLVLHRLAGQRLKLQRGPSLPLGAGPEEGALRSTLKPHRVCFMGSPAPGETPRASGRPQGPGLASRAALKNQREKLKGRHTHEAEVPMTLAWRSSTGCTYSPGHLGRPEHKHGLPRDKPISQNVFNQDK